MHSAQLLLLYSDQYVCVIDTQAAIHQRPFASRAARLFFQQSCPSCWHLAFVPSRRRSSSTLLNSFARRTDEHSSGTQQWRVRSKLETKFSFLRHGQSKGASYINYRAGLCL